MENKNVLKILSWYRNIFVTAVAMFNGYALCYYFTRHKVTINSKIVIAVVLLIFNIMIGLFINHRNVSIFRAEKNSKLFIFKSFLWYMLFSVIYFGIGGFIIIYLI